MSLRLLYRGSLRSCNYGCDYCPFVPAAPSPAAVDRDRAALDRFVAWARGQREPLSILFTPAGEALIHPWYRSAVVELSALPQVERVAVQTNLSGDLAWLAAADPRSVALWTTFHPSRVALERFVASCRALDALGLRYSVGTVGLREHLEPARSLRRLLDAGVYLWVNAYRDGGSGYYQPAEIAAFSAIDPLFPLGLRRHASRGRSCRAGASAISVDAEGTLRRCHFVAEPVGNLYTTGATAALTERPCPNKCCDCFIGYAHLDALGLGALFGAGLLERIPATPIWRQPEQCAATLAAAAGGAGADAENVSRSGRQPGGRRFDRPGHGSKLAFKI